MLHSLFFRCYLIMILVISLPGVLQAQYRYTPGYSYPDFQSERSHELFLHVNSHNFVRNNEYSSRFIPGQTLIGYGLQPMLTYYAGERLRLRGGVYLRQYSGMDQYSQVRPVLSAHLKLSPSVDIIMGGLRGHVYHRVIEPLFDPERQYLRPLETGLQFLVKRPWLWLDTWVDWEQFISEGDPFPERFTAGVSAEPSLRMLPEGWDLKFPVNVIAVHRGGEISEYPQPVETAMNSAAGIILEKELQGSLKKAGIYGYGMTYRNLNEVGPMDINQGQATYFGMMAESRRFHYMGGYFQGHDFLALKGQGLFQSYSPINGGNYVPTRELLTAKIGYNRLFLGKIRFSFLVETYYDISDHFLDYNAGMQIAFSPDFFLTETKFR